MLDANDILNAIKKAAADAVEAGKPVALLFGRVIKTTPLEIITEQKLSLDSAQLILTRNVTDVETDIAEDSQQERKTIKIFQGLKKGDKVILMRVQGGQKFLVLDKVVNL